MPGIDRREDHIRRISRVAHAYREAHPDVPWDIVQGATSPILFQTEKPANAAEISLICPPSNIELWQSLDTTNADADIDVGPGSAWDLIARNPRMKVRYVRAQSLHEGLQVMWDEYQRAERKAKA